jgi:hypothetical protein
MSLSRVWFHLVKNPGQTQAQIARHLGLRRFEIHRKIYEMEKKGYLLFSEGAKLYPAFLSTERSLMTVADYLVSGLGIPPLDEPSKPVTAVCAVTGLSITNGYPVWDIVPDSAGEFLDLLPNGVNGYVSETAARAIKGTWNLGSRIIFEDGTHYHPLIARDKTGERPCWSDLARTLWQERRGQSVLMILTTDVKKRVWHKARIGAFGNATPVMVYDVADSGLSSVQVIDWVVLLEILDTVENVYSMGFSKNGIRYSLLREWSRVQSFGTRQVVDLDNQLKPLREKTEFAMAVLISQKKETENENSTEQPELF